MGKYLTIDAEGPLKWITFCLVASLVSTKSSVAAVIAVDSAACVSTYACLVQREAEQFVCSLTRAVKDTACCLCRYCESIYTQLYRRDG